MVCRIITSNYILHINMAVLESRGSQSYTQVQVINIDVKDNHEDATLGAFLILKLCNMVRARKSTHTLANN